MKVKLLLDNQFGTRGSRNCMCDVLDVAPRDNPEFWDMTVSQPDGIEKTFIVHSVGLEKHLGPNWYTDWFIGDGKG